MGPVTGIADKGLRKLTTDKRSKKNLRFSFSALFALRCLLRRACGKAEGMGAGTSMGFAMGSAFAVLTHTTGSVGPSQVPARGRRRNKLAQDAKLVEDHSNLAKSSQGHDALHQRILESAHQRQLAMDKERGESRHVIKVSTAGAA